MDKKVAPSGKTYSEMIKTTAKHKYGRKTAVSWHDRKQKSEGGSWPEVKEADFGKGKELDRSEANGRKMN